MQESEASSPRPANRLREIVRLPVVIYALCLVVIIVSLFVGGPKTIERQQFFDLARQGRVTRLIIDDEERRVVARLRDGTYRKFYLFSAETVTSVLQEGGFTREMIQRLPQEHRRWSDSAVARLDRVFYPLMFILLLMVVTHVKLSDGGIDIRIGKKPEPVSQNGEVPNTESRFTYADVAGMEGPKRELAEIVEFLKDAKPFHAMGVRIPRGVLLYGEPGTGKTLLAKAVAGEAEVQFFVMSGSAFEEKYVGVGAARVRELFAQARKSAPSIIFIDEIDAVATERSTNDQEGSSAHVQTMNQILVEMDGFDDLTNVVVIASTNRRDRLDQAILRPGRFDRQIYCPLPVKAERLAILRVHATSKPLAPETTLELIADQTAGFSGAALEGVMNEAALIALRRKAATVEMIDLQNAIDRVLMGTEHVGQGMSLSEREATACHEAGHAIVGYFSQPRIVPSRISLVARGEAGGYVRSSGDEDRVLRRSDLVARLQLLLGGYAAEEVVLQEVSTGASQDLERASELATHMVEIFGMSQYFGPRVLLAEQCSEKDREAVSSEIQELLNAACLRAKTLIVENSSIHERLTRHLLETETIEAEDLLKILNDK